MSRARDTADTQDNVGGAVAPFVAGKNKLINGDFGIWQRGTSFTFTAATNYTADRFTVAAGVGGTVVVTQQTFTPGTAPVAGYEGAFFLNANYTTSGASVSDTGQHIEDVRTFAGQTITVSVWAKVSTGTHVITPQAVQRFGTGGSTAGATNGATWTLTTDWQRFSSSIAVPSVAGKTIGAGSSLQIRFESGTSGVKSFSFWGFQAEAGSVATPFTTASGSIGGELALCQRYYWRTTGQSAAANDLATGWANSTTNAVAIIRFPVTMRTAATGNFSAAADFGFTWSAGTSSISGANIDRISSESMNLRLTTSGLTTGQGGVAILNTGTAKYLEASAEL